MIDWDRISAAIFDGTKALVAKELSPLRKRLDQIEEKQASASLRFCGVWQAAQSYAPGSMVTHKGGLWHCNVPTREAPGTGHSWTLAVKSGEAGR